MSQMSNINDRRKLIEAVFEDRAQITPESVNADIEVAIEATISDLEQADFVSRSRVTMTGMSTNG